MLEQAHRWFRLLGNPTIELRALPRDKSAVVQVGIFSDLTEAAESALGLSDDTQYIGVYATLNKLHDKLTPTVVGRGRAVTDKQISRRTVLFLDIDPIREGKVCATGAEHDEALAAAECLKAHLTRLGWPDPIYVDTGSGSALQYRIDLPNDADSLALIIAVLVALAPQMPATVNLDTSVGNAARIGRVPGTVNRKSAHTDERPNRQVLILSAPDWLTPVTREQLETVAARTGSEVAATSDVESLLRLPPAEIKDRVDAVAAYLTAAKVGYRGPITTDRFVKFDIPTCVWKKEGDGNTSVLIWPSGQIAVHCFHAKCQGKSWSDFQKTVGDFKTTLRKLASAELSPDRAHNDPLALAERHLQSWPGAGGPSLAHFHGTLFRFDRDELWQKTSRSELLPWIRSTLQATFDQHAAIVSKYGEPVRPDPVDDKIVHHTYSAIESLAKRSIPLTEQSPFWLEPHDWQATDLLVLKNGILNIPRYLAGQDCWLPPTSRLFTRWRANFDFVKEPVPTPNWLEFLASLERSPEWIALLRQVMGYCLWREADLQKWFLLVGPSRCGKGTLTRIITDLVGGQAAACSLSPGNFSGEFGLEDAFDKAIGIMPELRVPKDPTAMVSTLKAITGGDPVSINRKRIAHVTLALKIKLLAQSNSFIVLPDNSGALMGRLVLLPFAKSYLGKEEPWKERLIPEYSGILQWALEGLRDLTQFVVPPESKLILADLQTESAPVKQFVEECCLTGGACKSRSLYLLYSRWAEDPLSESAFGNELRAAVPGVSKTRTAHNITTMPWDGDGRAQLWAGIRPRASTIQEFEELLCPCTT